MARTLIRLFLDTVATWHKPAQFLRRGERGWEAISADRALADVESLGLGLRHLGIRRGDRVALISENRYEWVVADLAILGLGAVTVPIYATLTPEQCRAILADSETRAVFVSNAVQLAKIRAVQRDLPQLEFIIPMEPALAEGPSRGAGISSPAAGRWRAPPTRCSSARKPTSPSPTTSPPSSTPRARPANPRARCSPTPTSRPTPRRA